MLKVEEIALTRLHPWDDNPRLNNHAVDAVAKSIRSFGFNVPILCDQNLTIVAGHTRWKAAQKLGMAKVPAIVVEMTDAQRRAFSIADNKTAEIADWIFQDYARCWRSCDPRILTSEASVSATRRYGGFC